MKSTPYVFDVQKFCIHDGPGIRTNIFFKGCALNCKWCANPESQSFEKDLFINAAKCIGCMKCSQACMNGAFYERNSQCMFDRSKCVSCGECVKVCYAGARKIYGKEYDVEDLIEEVESDETFYRTSGGGVTFSGGEPALCPDYVEIIAKYFQDKKISTAIETCGYAPWENYKRILPYIDYVLFDIKIWDSEKHKKYCGKSNELIFENLDKIVKTNNVTIRMPIIPEINDSEEELRSIGEYVKSLGKVNKIHILAYHNMATGKYDGLGREYTLPDIMPPTDEHMKWIKSVFEEYGLSVKIGG